MSTFSFLYLNENEEYFHIISGRTCRRRPASNRRSVPGQFEGNWRNCHHHDFFFFSIWYFNWIERKCLFCYRRVNVSGICVNGRASPHWSVVGCKGNIEPANVLRLYIGSTLIVTVSVDLLHNNNNNNNNNNKYGKEEGRKKKRGQSECAESWLEKSSSGSWRFRSSNHPAGRSASGVI